MIISCSGGITFCTVYAKCCFPSTGAELLIFYGFKSQMKGHIVIFYKMYPNDEYMVQTLNNVKRCLKHFFLLISEFEKINYS